MSESLVLLVSGLAFSLPAVAWPYPMTKIYGCLNNPIADEEYRIEDDPDYRKARRKPTIFSRGMNPLASPQTTGQQRPAIPTFTQMRDDT
jgi:hypothetical protein